MKRRLAPPVYELALSDSRVIRGGRSERAARRCLVDGLSQAEAGREQGITRQAVAAAMRLIERSAAGMVECCPMCGQGWPKHRQRA